MLLGFLFIIIVGVILFTEFSKEFGRSSQKTPKNNKKSKQYKHPNYYKW